MRYQDRIGLRINPDMRKTIQKIRDKERRGSDSEVARLALEAGLEVLAKKCGVKHGNRKPVV